MFRYVLIILLPAAAMCLCQTNAPSVYFASIDSNNDSYVEPSEANDFVNGVDVDGDGAVTLEEAQEIIPDLIPALAGREQEIIDFSDVDKDGQITGNDVVEGFRRFDEDEDDRISPKEFQNYVNVVCGNV